LSSHESGRGGQGAGVGQTSIELGSAAFFAGQFPQVTLACPADVSHHGGLCLRLAVVLLDALVQLPEQVDEHLRPELVLLVDRLYQAGQLVVLGLPCLPSCS
jgi:hypothetical protein